MSKTGALVAKNLDLLAKLKEQVETEGVRLFIAGSLEDVEGLFQRESIDFVALGRVNEPVYRLRVLKHILTVSPATSVHVMGRGGDAPSFVKGVIKGLTV